MGKNELIREIEDARLKKDIPDFRIGDTIKVNVRIIEEGGKERIQTFKGTVIARKGSGLSETVTLHRIAYGEGMERIFFLHSPLVSSIEIDRRGKVRRGKLYYLRGRTGKAAKIKDNYKVQRQDLQRQALAKAKSKEKAQVRENAQEETAEIVSENS